MPCCSRVEQALTRSRRPDVRCSMVRPSNPQGHRDTCGLGILESFGSGVYPPCLGCTPSCSRLHIEVLARHWWFQPSAPPFTDLTLLAEAEASGISFSAWCISAKVLKAKTSPHCSKGLDRTGLRCPGAPTTSSGSVVGVGVRGVELPSQWLEP